jgi:hypothetical protein|tara:strand:+ start:284 stop:637 length:354 start_codon:yes stop_codon:yes gene_type:complete
MGKSKYKFNFISEPNQIFVKEDDYGEEIDIFDHFDTDDSDDFIAGYFKEIDYEKGIITIIGELSEEDIEKLLESESHIRGGVPNIYDVAQRIAILNDTWDIEWKTDELRDEDNELIS